MDNYTESRAARQEDRDLVNAAVTARKPLDEEYRGSYSPLCSACWLNHPHTTGAHFESISESLTPGTELHRQAVARGYIVRT